MLLVAELPVYNNKHSWSHQKQDVAELCVDFNQQINETSLNRHGEAHVHFLHRSETGFFFLFMESLLYEKIKNVSLGIYSELGKADMVKMSFYCFIFPVAALVLLSTEQKT